MTRSPEHRARNALVLVMALVLLGGCGDPLKGGGEGGAGGEIVIGSSDVPENRLISQLYASALRASGAAVTIRPPVGGREVVVKALQDKSLSLTPDYSGNLLQYFDERSEASRPARVYGDLRASLPRAFEVLRPAPAQDKDVLVVRKRLGISSMAQLGPLCPNLVFGGPGQWRQRWKDKIKVTYGCRFGEITTTDTGGPVTVEALRSGDAQVVDLFSTDSRIRRNGFVPLDDPRNMFPAQNIVPLAARGVLTTGQKRVLDRLSAALTTERLAALNEQYTVQKRDPVDISGDFLRANGLA